MLIRPSESKTCDRHAKEAEKEKEVIDSDDQSDPDAGGTYGDTGKGMRRGQLNPVEEESRERDSPHLQEFQKKKKERQMRQMMA